MTDFAPGQIPVAIDRELVSIVPEYLENRRRDCAEIERLLACDGLEAIRFIGHRMKGSGGSFGFDEISDIGETLEISARLADADAIRTAVGRLEGYLARISVIYV